jgi:peptidoglycan/LPS O-acetylase OafA/YrhL
VLVLNLLMVQGWGLAPSLSGTAWSISTEWFAYLLFPASLFLALRGGWGRAAMLLMPALAVLLAMTWAADPPLAYLETPRRGPFDLYHAASLWPLARTVAEFSLGLLAYRVLAANWARNVWANPMTAAVVAGAIVALMAQPGTDLLIVPLFPLLVLTLAVGEHFLARFFASPPLHALGVLSYAIYMLHPRTNRAITALLARLAESTGKLGPIATPTLSFALLLAAAAAAYWGVEKPGRRLLRSLSVAAPRAPRRSTGVRS